MLIYFSCKKKSKQNNSVVSISFVKTFIKHRFRLLLVINDQLGLPLTLATRSKKGFYGITTVLHIKLPSDISAL